MSSVPSPFTTLPSQEPKLVLTEKGTRHQNQKYVFAIDGLFDIGWFSCFNDCNPNQKEINIFLTKLTKFKL